MSKKRIIGFSLAELLIALGILGILAAFTVPKLLNPPNNSLNSKQSAMAKDVVFMVSSAYEQYRMANATVASSTTAGAFTPYMNYVNIQTTGQMDDHLGVNAAYDCSSNVTCLKLHNGGTFFYSGSQSFGGSNTTNGIYVFFDADSVRTGVSTDAPGKALCFFIYYDGRIRSRGNTISGTRNSGGSTYNPGSYDPSWFSGF